MEAAAIAHVAAIHGLPFLSVKDISNNEFHEATDLDAFTDFPIGEVGKRAAALLTATIERWATTRYRTSPGPESPYSPHPDSPDRPPPTRLLRHRRRVGPPQAPFPASARAS
jgi:hypothetical protein